MTAGVFHKKLNEMIWEHRVLKRLMFFYYIGMTALYFQRMDVFLTNYGHESSHIVVKSRGKKASYWFFCPWYSIVLTEFTFLTKYGYDNRGFSWMFKKMTWEHSVFERMEFFYDTWQRWYFCEKSGNKGIL